MGTPSFSHKVLQFPSHVDCWLHQIFFSSQMFQTKLSTWKRKYIYGTCDGFINFKWEVKHCFNFVVYNQDNLEAMLHGHSTKSKCRSVRHSDTRVQHVGCKMPILHKHKEWLFYSLDQLEQLYNWNRKTNKEWQSNFWPTPHTNIILTITFFSSKVSGLRKAFQAHENQLTNHHNWPHDIKLPH